MLALLSGVLLAFSLPSKDIAILGWVAFLPLLIASRITRNEVLAAGCGMLVALMAGYILMGKLS